MPPVEFEPAIPASERPQAHALDGAANWDRRVEVSIDPKRIRGIKWKEHCINVRQAGWFICTTNILQLIFYFQPSNILVFNGGR
jgi:hypothetical protein